MYLNEVSVLCCTVGVASNGKVSESKCHISINNTTVDLRAVSHRKIRVKEGLSRTTISQLWPLASA